MREKNNNDSNIRKVLFNEVTVVVAIIAFAAPIFGAYFDIRMKLALLDEKVSTMQTNELVHIQQSISDINQRNIATDERQKDMEIKLTKIMTILGQE